MTETHDPWANVFQTAMEGGWSVYYADEVNAARAAVERQHAAALQTEQEARVAAEQQAFMLATRIEQERTSHAAALADSAQDHATERDMAIAVVTARHVDELAKKDDALGRWLQTGLTLMKFFGAAPRMAEADMPDFLWREVPALIRSLRNTLREANAENATLRAQVETLTAERQSLLRDVFTKAADIEALRASLAAVEGERDRLKAALLDVTTGMDRAGGDRDGMPECPWCQSQWDYDHSGDCALVAARAALTPQGQSTDGETR